MAKFDIGLKSLEELTAEIESKFSLSDEHFMPTVGQIDRNLKRKISPSEKAFAYKMKYDAIKIQQMNASQVGTKRSDDILAEQTGESRNQVQRYIRLTYLMPELLDMTDAGKLKFNPAVEISYLSEEMQKALLEVIEEDKVMPSLVQATAIKELAKEVGDITADDIRNLLKKPQKPAALDTKRIMQLVPPFVSKGEENDFIEKAIKHYLNFVDEDGE